MKINIAIIGLGYVGLPLAVELGKHFNVIGFDIDKLRINELLKGHDRTKECSKKSIKSSKQLNFSNNEDDLKKANLFIVTVPTPITESKLPDTSPLENACKLIGSIISKKSIVVFESTVYPGMTEEFCVPIIESVSGLKYVRDFGCGYSPERINPGDKENTLVNIKKIISASDVKSLRVIKSIYSKIIKAGIFEAPSIKVAEAAKVIENVQRDVNIALVNELSQIFYKIGIDTNEVINAAASKWNFIDYRPGLVGGHCIGVDPYYLTFKAQQVGHHPKMILSGRGINEDMPEFAAMLMIRAMIDKKISISRQSLLILGLTFKENCPDLRNSKVYELVEQLSSFGFSIDIFDPYHRNEKLQIKNCNVLKDLPKSTKSKYGGIILAVPHKEIISKGSKHIKSYGKNPSVFFDMKGFFRKSDSDLRL